MFIGGGLFAALFDFFSHLEFKIWLVLFCLLIAVSGLCLYGFEMKRIYDGFDFYDYAGDLDLLYFIVKEQYLPFEDACAESDRNPGEFRKICKYFTEGLGNEI